MKKNVFIVRPLHKEYILRVYIIFPYNFEIHPPVFLHYPWGWSWAQSCSSQFLGRKKGAIFSRSAGKPWIFLGFPACGWNSMAFIMLPGKKCSLDPWSVKDDLRKLLFFASESIKNTLWHNGRSQPMPSTPFTSTMGRMGQYQPQFLLHEKLTGGFFCVFVSCFHVLWQKIWLKIWQSFESHNLIPVNFIRSLRNEPWIWHDFGHVAFRGIHLQATYQPAGRLTWLNGKAIFILVLQDVVVLGALRRKNDSERTEHRERCH